MKRRTFIFQTGTLITTAMLAQCNTSVGTKTPYTIRRPNPNDFKAPALKAIALGMNAPNPHNTQAWKFQLHSDTTFTLYVDESRLLPATDPTTRQIHIGCGCFLSVMQAGISVYGYTPQINLLPEGEYQVDQTGKFPVAHVSLISTEPITDPLAKAILTRTTNRLAYQNYTLSFDEFKSILLKTKAKYSTIKLINDSTVADHLSCLYEGMVIESTTYKTYDESRIWFRENDYRIEQLRDGINLSGAGTTGFKKWLAEKILKGLNEKDWHNSSAINQYLSSYEKKVKSSKAVVHLITDANTQLNWIQAGMDYARFQLAALLHNYYIHPMSQVLQEYEEMNTLRQKYDQLNKITGEQKIQMAFRIGKAAQPFYSYRRNLNDLLLP